MEKLIPLLLIIFFLNNTYLINNCYAQNTLGKVVGLNGSPIVYDEEDGEYHLVWFSKENGKRVKYTYILRFDPFDGHPLDSSPDSNLFVPNAEEISRLTHSLEGINSLKEFVELYGKPDKVWKRADGSTQYDFGSYFETIDAFLHVDASGDLSAGFTPKVRKKQNKSVNKRGN